MARIAIATALACAACARTGGEPPLADVTRGDLVITVPVTGALRAVDATPVKSPALLGGSMLKLVWVIPEGSEVAPRDRLVELEMSDLETNLEGARSWAEQADKRLERRRQAFALARRDEHLRLLQAEAEARRAALNAEVASELVTAIARKEHQLDRELADRKLEQTRQEIAASRHSDEVDLQDQIDSRDAARRRIAELEASRALLATAAPRAGTVVYGPGTGGDARNTGDTLWQSDVILQVVNQLVSAWGTQVQVDTGQRMVYDVAGDVFARLQRLSLLFHSRRSVGDSSIARRRSAASIRSASPGTWTKAREGIVSAASTMGRPVIPSHPTVPTSTVPSRISLTIEMIPVNTKYTCVMGTPGS